MCWSIYHFLFALCLNMVVCLLLTVNVFNKQVNSFREKHQPQKDKDIFLVIIINSGVLEASKYNIIIGCLRILLWLIRNFHVCTAVLCYLLQCYQIIFYKYKYIHIYICVVSIKYKINFMLVSQIFEYLQHLP